MKRITPLSIGNLDNNSLRQIPTNAHRFKASRNRQAVGSGRAGCHDGAERRHRGRCKWRDLLFGGLNDTMFGVISDLLRRPFTLWRFVEIVAPGFAADGGALKHSVLRRSLPPHQSISFCFWRSWCYTSPRYRACPCTPAGGRLWQTLPGVLLVESVAQA